MAHSHGWSWCWLSASGSAEALHQSVHMWLLTARWLESNSKCCKRREVEAASLLRSEPGKGHNTIYVTIYWSSSHRAAWIQGMGCKSPRVPSQWDTCQEFVVIFDLPQISNWGRLCFHLYKCQYLIDMICWVWGISLPKEGKFHHGKRVLF